MLKAFVAYPGNYYMFIKMKGAGTIHIILNNWVIDWPYLLSCDVLTDI